MKTIILCECFCCIAFCFSLYRLLTCIWISKIYILAFQVLHLNLNKFVLNILCSILSIEFSHIFLLQIISWVTSDVIRRVMFPSSSISCYRYYKFVRVVLIKDNFIWNCQAIHCNQFFEINQQSQLFPSYYRKKLLIHWKLNRKLLDKLKKNCDNSIYWFEYTHSYK